jgi:lipid II:glycine glycyltransferase (peptidoglycan interpeptide bridge formation enzyme)
VSVANRGSARPHDAESWNGHLERLGGHLLQSWQWGDFKSRYGWHAERVAYPEVGEPRAMAQVLFKFRGPVSVAYVPRGPAVAAGDEDAASALFRIIDRLARRNRSLYLIVEPNSQLPFTGTFKQHGFVRGPDHIQPERTVQVPLLEDEPLLNQMHSKTRYSVRLAGRRGVTLEVPEDRDAGASEFYELLRDTAERNVFGIHSESYYHDFLSVMGDHAALLLARHEGHLAAGVIAARFGREAIYMYGGSSSQFRAHGAAFMLQFEAMRWGREGGSTIYDLWGIPAEDPDSNGSETGRVSSTKGDDWRGLYRFKTGFGGDIVGYPQPIERRYHRFLAAAARKVATHRE